MRMDRYDEEEKNDSTKTRTNKNQELYTDVYLNNAFVDISEINEVVHDEEEEEDNSKTIPKSEEVVAYSYVKKNYDINSLIEEAIIKNGNDNIKRSMDDELEIDNIIESINESHEEKEESDELLSDLLPDSDTTTVVSGLGEAIVDTSNVDTSVIHQDEMSNDMIESMKEDDDEVLFKKKTKKDDNLESESKSNKKKVIFIIIGIILLIAIIIGVLIWKKIIKF